MNVDPPSAEMPNPPPLVATYTVDPDAIPEHVVVAETLGGGAVGETAPTIRGDTQLRQLLFSWRRTPSTPTQTLLISETLGGGVRLVKRHSTISAEIPNPPSVAAYTNGCAGRDAAGGWVVGRTRGGSRRWRPEDSPGGQCTGADEAPPRHTSGASAVVSFNKLATIQEAHRPSECSAVTSAATTSSQPTGTRCRRTPQRTPSALNPPSTDAPERYQGSRTNQTSPTRSLTITLLIRTKAPFRIGRQERPAWSHSIMVLPHKQFECIIAMRERKSSGQRQRRPFDVTFDVPFVVLALSPVCAGASAAWRTGPQRFADRRLRLSVAVTER